MLRNAVHRGLARVLRKCSIQPDKQLEFYQNLEEGNESNQQFVWGLIQTLLSNGEVARAVTRYERLARDMKREGVEVEPRFVPAQFNLEIAKQKSLAEDKRDWRAAGDLLKQINQLDTLTDEQKYKYAANFLMAQGKKEQAEKLLGAATARFNDDLQFRLYEVETTFQSDGFSAANEKLQSCRA